MAMITVSELTPVLSPRIFGPITFPSNCWITIMRMMNSSALEGLDISTIKKDGMAPINGPNTGIILVTPTKVAISIL